MTTPLLTRAQIGLRPPRSTPSRISTEGQTAHYGGPSPWRNADTSSPTAFRDSTDHGRCASIWRAWQAFHMDSRGWTDIAYNSGFCPHGVRFEGRGPGRRSGANGTNDGNARSTASCYIAGDDDPITDEAKAAYLDECERMASPPRWQHGDWKSTACAGPSIRAWKAAGWPWLGTVTAPPSAPPVVPPAPTTGGPRVTVNMTLTVIRNGSRGDDVRRMQRLIRDHAGGGITVDGVFGPATERRVKDLQAFFGLTADGIVGEKTWGIALLVALQP